MDGREFRRAVCAQHDRRVEKGDRVRVTYGTLTEIVGTIVDYATNCRCVIELRDHPAVRIVLPFDCVALDRGPPPAWK